MIQRNLLSPWSLKHQNTCLLPAAIWQTSTSFSFHYSKSVTACRDRGDMEKNRLTCKQIISGFHIRSSSHITLLRWFHFRYGEGTLVYKALCFHAFLSANMLYDTTLNFSATSKFITKIICKLDLKYRSIFIWIVFPIRLTTAKARKSGSNYHPKNFHNWGNGKAIKWTWNQASTSVVPPLKTTSPSEPNFLKNNSHWNENLRTSPISF